MLRTVKDLQAIEPRVASVLKFLCAQPSPAWQAQTLRPLASSTFSGPGYDQPGEYIEYCTNFPGPGPV